MKIILISPYPDLKSFGIRTLSSCLKREGYNAQLIFLPMHFTKRYEEKTLNEVVELSKGANLIGISLMTNIFENAVQITQRLKKEDDSIPIVWGGVHATVCPEECLNYADIVCIGEGEKTLVELVKKIEKDGCYYDIQGIWFKDKEKFIKNQKRPLTQDLDTIQFQDYDYETHYILNNGCLHKMDAHLLDGDLCGTYITMPTRGCPFGCTYCCNFTFNEMYPKQKPIRKRSIDNVIKELKEVKNKLPFIKKISFIDDAFLIYSEKEIKELCEKYTENVGLPFTIDGGATPSTLTREKLLPLVDAGLVDLKMGIQTASERMKKLYNRHHSNEQVERAVKTINEFKDKIPMPHYDILLDNPWENDEDLIETLMFLSKLQPPYQLNTYSLTFYPGTDLYRRAKRDGIITDELQDIYRKDYYFYSCRKTYLNKLFFLLNAYAFYGITISPKIMSLLTNQNIRRIKLHWLLYILLKIGALYLKKKRLKDLLYSGLKDIQKGDWIAIQRKLLRWF